MTALVLAASPVAFVLLAVILAGVGLAAHRAARSLPSRLPRSPSQLPPSSCFCVSSPRAAGFRSRFPSSRLPVSSADSASCSRGASARPVCCVGCASSTSSRVQPRISSLPASARTSPGCDTQRSPSPSWRCHCDAGDRYRSLYWHSRSPLPGICPACRQLRQGQRRSRGRSCLLGACGAVPPRPPDAVIPCRGSRHRWPLAGSLSPRRRHPDRTRLVPAGRLPAERCALRRARPRFVPELAPLARCPVRRAARRTSRLRRQARRGVSQAVDRVFASCSDRPTRLCTPFLRPERS